MTACPETASGAWRMAWLVALVAAACSEGPPPGSVPAADGGADASRRPPPTPGSSDPAPAGVLEVRSIALPPVASDWIPLRILVASGRGLPVRLQIDVSVDAGQSYRPARLRGAIADLPPSPTGAEYLVEWSSREDVGFHVPRAARLRVVAADSRGASAPLSADTPNIDNLRVAARRVSSYIIHYGSWDPTSVALAKRHDLVILHPTAASLRRPLIADLQAGLDPADPADDVIVLCYLSAGEDERVYRVSDEAAAMDPRFRGDGSGPRVDPRGVAAGGALADLDPRGLPSPGGTGWASYYLDDNSVFRDPAHKGDGIPDRNLLHGGYFVNAGDPAWFSTLQDMLLERDRVAGLREMLTTDHGRGFGCDGLFLDTIDTASPNNDTAAGSPNLARFEWTAPGMSRFVTRLREAYPDRLLLQNRGLFYFDPRRPHYRFTTRGKIDFFFFESYRLGSRPTPDNYHRDNRWNVTPKLMAEANRPDGFTVLSLGYAEGTGLPGALDTLTGKSMVGLESLLEDIRVAQELAGFRHYIGNAAISLVNTFVRDHSNFDDRTPPRWTSTFNARAYDPMLGAQEPAPRVGIQEVVPAPGGLIVRWDVALDLHRVGYALYYQETPFDFDADPKLQRATRRLLTPALPSSYAQGAGPTVYPNEALVRPLQPGRTYHLLIRAFDSAPAANEETNTVTLTGIPSPP
jgi:hypothetical protein